MTAVIWRLTVLSLFLSVLNSLPARFYLLEINSSLGGYYLGVHLFSIVFLLVFRKQFSHRVFWLPLGLLVLLSAGYTSNILDYYAGKAPQTVAPDGQELSVFYANVNKHRGNPEKLNQALSKYHPDLVFLLEIDEGWLGKVPILERYPYQVEVPRLDLFGLALYSKYPLGESIRKSVGPNLPPIILTTIFPETDRELVVVGLHAMPPMSTDNYERSWLLLRRVSSLLRHDTRPVIIAGDFNSTPFGRLFRGFRGSEYRSASQGFGLWRTWNALHPLLRLKLDHILLRGEMQVLEFKRVEDIGSDHFPLFVRMRLKEAASS